VEAAPDYPDGIEHAKTKQSPAGRFGVVVVAAAAVVTAAAASVAMEFAPTTWPSLTVGKCFLLPAPRVSESPSYALGRLF
jgi:hypothetical protein